MNNKIITALFCFTVLALTPSCKRQKNAATKEDVNTMIEVESTVFETEENIETQESVIKF